MKFLAANARILFGPELLSVSRFRRGAGSIGCTFIGVLSSRGGAGVTVGDFGPAQPSPFARALLDSFASGIKRFESTVAETFGPAAGAGPCTRLVFLIVMVPPEVSRARASESESIRPPAPLPLMANWMPTFVLVEGGVVRGAAVGSGPVPALHTVATM